VAAGKPADRGHRSCQELHEITPLDVDHIDILEGQVAFIDISRAETMPAREAA
jgi:hypothetical protein